MYVHYVKDHENHGRIIGVVVAVATNRVGYVLAHPHSLLNKEMKETILAYAIWRAMEFSVPNNIDSIQASFKDDPNSSPSNYSYNRRRELVLDAYTTMVYKASKAKNLPTLVEPIKE